MGGYRHSKKILHGPAVHATGDRYRDTVISALYGLEAREGERLGWDREPSVWTIRLQDIDAVSFDVERVQPRQWRRGQANPADDLLLTARPFPAPPVDLPEISFADSPGGIAAVVFMCEGWGLESDEYDPDRDFAGGVRRNYLHPKRIECRSIQAVDVNGWGYTIMRARGEEPSKPQLADREQMLAGQGTGFGNVFAAMHRLAYAARRTVWPA